MNAITRHSFKLILAIGIIAYIIYFSYFSILRYHTIYASYYDLGIMNQTAYNTFRSIKDGDSTRFLEMTDTEGPFQIKRMAIHNDIFLSVLAIFYFIFAGPETLLIIQSIVLGLGAIAIYGIATHVLKEIHRMKTVWIEVFAVAFSFSYLLYPAMQRTNMFDFHPVVLGTTFLLFMFYFWLKKNYFLSLMLFLFSLLLKENVGLLTVMFGIYILLQSNFKTILFTWNSRKLNFKNVVNQLLQHNKFSIFIIVVSICWVLLSFLVIIPSFRGTDHFASEYYKVNKSIGLFFKIDTLWYFVQLLGPVSFFSLLSPLQLFIAIPEFAINLLSSNGNMRNTIYHYTALITPWIFISAVYGVRRILIYINKLHDLSSERKYWIVVSILIGFVFVFSYINGPLPFSLQRAVHPFLYPQKNAEEIRMWADRLKEDSIKISTTGQIAPFFTSRRYFYLYNQRYSLADYVVLRKKEIYEYPEKEQLIPIYERMIQDRTFQKIYDFKDVEVYKKITN